MIAVLLGLSLTWVRAARQNARGAVCLANVSICLGAMAAYASDFRDAFPRAGRSTYEESFDIADYPLGYYSQARFWTIPMRGYLGGAIWTPAVSCPSDRLDRDRTLDEVIASHPVGWEFGSDYWLSYAMFTDPLLWRDGEDLTDPKWFRVVRHAEVTFPSLKAALVEERSAHLAPPKDYYPRDYQYSIRTAGSRPGAIPTIGFADGSVAAVRATDLLPGNKRAAGADDTPTPAICTPEGVRGRDVAARGR